METTEYRTPDEPDTGEGDASGDAGAGRMRVAPLLVLSAAQFLMVIDTSVMNVSISTLVAEFDTTVTAIQSVITAYSLVMAAAMITGGKLGDLLGRRRAFRIGLVVYGVGSLITAVSPSLAVLFFGWSLLEGLGAALVMPAMVALVAGNYTGRARATAFGVLGGIAGAAVAVGPIIGGWVTTYASWRYVFAAEVVIVVLTLVFSGKVAEARLASQRQRFDVVGAVLSAVGMALVVLGVLRSSDWGWLAPRNSPFTLFGFSATPFVVGAGFAALWGFAAWQRRREARDEPPLVHVGLLRITPLRAGLVTLLGQQVILMGVFFVISLYLQVVLGFDAFETGLRLIPVSVTLLVAAMGGSRLSTVASPRTIVRIGLVGIIVGIVVLMTAIDPELSGPVFAIALGFVGTGIGLLASQLGNAIQSSVDDAARSEVGGLQYTSQNLGAALGTALIGAIVISALGSALVSGLAEEAGVSDAVKQQVGVSVERGVSFVDIPTVEKAVAEAGVPEDEATAIVSEYAEAQLQSLKTGLLAAIVFALVVLAATRGLPSTRAGDDADDAAADGGDAPTLAEPVA